MNNANVKFENHFKLYVPFRDKIIFESELINNNIEFYYEENQPNINISVKYFLKDSDANEIDKIIRENQIISSIENQILDYKQEQKIQKLYLKVATVTIIIILVASAIIAYFK